MVIFLGRTHVIISLVVYSIFYNYIDKPIPLVILFLFTGSLLADADSPNSLFGRWIYPVSSVTKHRNGWTHSIMGSLLFSLPVLLFFDRVYFVVFLVAYLLHVITDSFTPSGVKLLFPFTKKNYSLNLIKTNSREEYVVFMLSLVYLLGIGYK